ncbi:Leucine-rich repeat domain-containing protein [Flavobacterium longum]|uniref:leucine-rich repeat domain-containing protein n=1 Tax=Flavobacterium longum TaxID=1299340 RepID=UPI0039EA5D73
MKNFCVAVLLLLPLLGIGQCVKCTTFTDAQKDPSKVTSIKMNSYLADEEITKIPDNIGDYSNLEELFLTDYGFTELPASFAKLKNLKSLSLAGNEFTQLPESVFQLTQLKELILFSNAFPDQYKKDLKARIQKEMPNTKLMID